jgi:hypothetical protein
MSKSDFVCAICKQVKSASLLGGGKYKCPTHKFICSDHVSGFVAQKCTECSSRVLKYLFSRAKGKWEKA